MIFILDGPKCYTTIRVSDGKEMAGRVNCDRSYVRPAVSKNVLVVECLSGFEFENEEETNRVTIS